MVDLTQSAASWPATCLWKRASRLQQEPGNASALDLRMAVRRASTGRADGDRPARLYGVVCHRAVRPNPVRRRLHLHSGRKRSITFDWRDAASNRIGAADRDSNWDQLAGKCKV